MKITCTVNEFAKMIRKCNPNGCYSCIMSDICDGDDLGIERFIAADDVVSEKAQKDGKSDENT